MFSLPYVPINTKVQINTQKELLQSSWSKEYMQSFAIYDKVIILSKNPRSCMLSVATFYSFSAVPVLIHQGNLQTFLWICYPSGKGSCSLCLFPLFVCPLGARRVEKPHFESPKKTTPLSESSLATLLMASPRIGQGWSAPPGAAGVFWLCGY